MTVNAKPERDDAAVSRFIERFASALVEAGMPRMPSRIFAALLVSDSGKMSAAGLASLLHVSPAAVSGGVRYLTQVNLARREREPGARRDLIVIHDDVWYEASVSRDQMIKRYETSLREGVEAVGRDTPAGARLADTLSFFEFVQSELPGLLVKWRERKARDAQGSE